MKTRMLRWANSIHAHMLALAFGVMMTLTAFSLTILFTLNPPERVPVSVYEISRIVRGLPLVREVPIVREQDQDEAPPMPTDPAERLISALLAKQLHLPGADVRVRLNEGDNARFAQISREAELYGAEGAADPYIVGTFTAAVRKPSGGWRLVTREARSPQNLWRLTGRNTFLVGLLLIIPLSMWFSARLTRPIRAFATAAERLGAGVDEKPLPIKGPTEIRMAAQSLNEMQSRIARYVLERTSLVGAIAHDLRTPLSRLHFHLANAPDPIRKAAEGEISQMEKLIGTTLDFVDNESRPRVMEPLDLGLLVEGLVDDFADMGQDVAMDEAQSIIIDGDMILLKRLFTNLIDNAVKYGGSAQLSVRHDATQAIVEVSDRGPGIAEPHLARAFEPFYRGEPSRNRRTGGVGLGLSIVQSAAHAHGGLATLEARPGGGTIARVLLPLPGSATSPF
jgi:two-component system OmpR family sensor kinase